MTPTAGPAGVNLLRAAEAGTSWCEPDRVLQWPTDHIRPFTRRTPGRGHGGAARWQAARGPVRRRTAVGCGQARCVKAAVRYNANGEFNQSPDNRRRGAHPDRMADHIQRSSLILRDKVQMSSQDYRYAMANATTRDLVYMDPPYQGVSTNRDRRYRDVLDFDEFVSALEELSPERTRLVQRGGGVMREHEDMVIAAARTTEVVRARRARTRGRSRDQRSAAR